MIQSYAHSIVKGDVITVTSGDLSGGIYTISPDINDVLFVVQTFAGIKLPPCVVSKRFIVFRDTVNGIYFIPDDDGTEVIRGRSGGFAVDDTTEFEMPSASKYQMAFVFCISTTEWVVNCE